MSEQPQDRPPQAPSAGSLGGVGGVGAVGGIWPAASGPSTPGPYAGQPGTPMPAYDLDAAAGPRDHQNALIAFILGIFSVVGFSVVGPVAWMMASKALKEIDRPGGPAYTNRGLAVAAKVLGIIGTILLGLSIIVLIGFVVFALVSVKRGA